MLTFNILDNGYSEYDLGYVPGFFSEEDPKTAAEQINENYAHGGGWMPMKKWERVGDTGIRYPGDETIYPVAMAHLRDETIYLYESAWMMIVQANNDFEVARID